jgi:signal transduction histidine kinase
MEPLRQELLRAEQLKREFRQYRALVQRARERAVRAAEEAVALRTILKAQSTSDTPQQRNLWVAAARAVTEVGRERDRILATVSHEMRQALSAAVAAEHVLIGHPTDPAALKAADVLDRQLGHLSKLVEILLDYSRRRVGPRTLAPRRQGHRPRDDRGV